MDFIYEFFSQLRKNKFLDIFRKLIVWLRSNAWQMADCTQFTFKGETAIFGVLDETRQNIVPLSHNIFPLMTPFISYTVNSDMISSLHTMPQC